MRLVDIDDVSLLKSVSVGGLSAKALWRLICKQPTVDAIPVEWIRNWIELSDVWDDIDDMLADWAERKEE